MDATGLGIAIRNKKISVKEAVSACAVKIENEEQKINALITDLLEDALIRAGEIEQEIYAGSCGHILAGIPFCVKDNISMKDVRFTCASRMLDRYKASYTATALEQILDAGALCMGKTNLDEFAMGSTGESSYYGATRNPFDLRRVAGGSSSGSAAAVAVGGCFFALGSDSGGSVRLPAAYCGLVGLLPTYGRVSRYGLVAHVSSMDQIGCITRSVRDSAAVLSLLAGKDRHDATTVAAGSDFSPGEDICGYKIAVLDPESYDADESISKAVEEAAKLLEKQGADVKLYTADFMKTAERAYRIIECAEASSNLARFDGIKYGGTGVLASNIESRYALEEENGFGKEVIARIRRGRYYLSEGFEKYFCPALAERQRIMNEMRRLFSAYDVLLLPVAKDVAPFIGESKPCKEDENGPDIFTTPANMAQLPAITIPFGQKEGMPIGIQLIADRFCEKKLLTLAAVIEKMIKRNENVHNI